LVSTNTPSLKGLKFPVIGFVIFSYWLSYIQLLFLSLKYTLKANPSHKLVQIGRRPTLYFGLIKQSRARLSVRVFHSLPFNQVLAIKNRLLCLFQLLALCLCQKKSPVSYALVCLLCISTRTPFRFSLCH